MGQVSLLAITPRPEMLFGLMLVAALAGGHLASLVHVPRVVGFLLAGVALRAALYGLYGSDAGGVDELAESAEPLEALRDLALGMILFVIGGVFERSQLRSGGSQLLKISVSEITLTAVLVSAACLTAVMLTPSETELGERLALVLLLGLAAIATAPAATVIVLQEYESKGAITDTILGLTASNNIVCIILFHAAYLLLAASGVVATTGEIADHVIPALLGTTFGSVVVGVALGTLLSMAHAKLRLVDTLLVFFAIFLLLGAGENALQTYLGVSYNFLLTALVLGAVFANVAIDPQKLMTTLRTVGAPILAGFFVMAGYGLHLEDLGKMGWIGVAYVVARYAGKRLGCRIGATWASGRIRDGDRLGGALLCQAAVVIGLATFVERSWDSDLARVFSTVILGSVVVFELIGPIMVKRCVVHGGEVKAITLMSRTGPATEGTSVARLTVQALMRMLPVRAENKNASPDMVVVRHVMRTSVQFIPAAAAFDEVLHLIERSTYSHFPVVHEDGDFAGVIHFADIRDVIYDPNLRELVTAVDLAEPAATTVPMEMPLADALEAFTKANLTVMAVVERFESKRVVGVVEMRDILKALHVSQKVE